MKVFFYQLLAGLGLLVCATFTGCSTNSGGGFSLDTPQRHTTASSGNPENFFAHNESQSPAEEQPTPTTEQSQMESQPEQPSFQPSDPESFFYRKPASQVANIARFRVGETVDVAFSGAPAGDILQSQPHQQIIKEDGTITLPYIGSIYVLGKTAGEVQNEIYTNYVPRYYVRLTVTVTPGDSYFYVGGEVGHAGVFQYISDTTVTKAIQAAGGLTPFSSHSKIWLTHASTGKRIRVNYDDALRNPAKDPPVYPDDQINVEASAF